MENTADKQDEKLLFGQRTQIPMIDSPCRKIPMRMKLQKLEDKKLVAVENKQQLTILVISWNLMGSVPDDQNIRKLLTKDRRENQIIVIGTQECQRPLFNSFFCEGKELWQGVLATHFNSTHRLVTSEVLQGLHTVAFVRNDLYPLITNVRTQKLKTGFLGIIGNKGAIELSFSICNRHLKFINTHLQAFQEQAERRTHDLMTVVERFVHPQTSTPSGEPIFLFGDFNYRIAISLQQSRALKNDKSTFEDYLQKDQFVLQTALSDFQRMFKQKKIEFPPTYKLSTTDNTYTSSRIPGWTDRIFHQCEDGVVQQTQYTGDFDVLGSDHRPVIGAFITHYTKKPASREVQVRASSRCNLI